MEHEDVISYIEHATKFKRKEFGASSITFKSEFTTLTVFRRGKKQKDIANSVVLGNFTVSDAVDFAEAIRIETIKNDNKMKVSVSNEDRLAKLLAKKKDKTVTDSSRDW